MKKISKKKRPVKPQPATGNPMWNPGKAKAKPFHVSTRGHGSSTYCGIEIPPFGSGTGGPNWGGQTPDDGHTCLDCVMRYVALKMMDLDDAVKVLFLLVKERGLLKRE